MKPLRGRAAPFPSENAALLIVLLLLAVFTVRVVSVISVQSPTYDETTCLNASLYIANTLSWDHVITVQHPPLSYFWYGSFLKRFPFASFEDGVFKAKLLMLFFPMLLGYFLYRWTKELFGIKAGIAAVLFFTLCPTVTAHSGLITQDILVTTFIFLSLYSFEKFLQRPLAMKTMLFAGSMFGFALLSKYTAVFLLPIYILRLALEEFREKGKLRTLLARSALVFCLGLFILNLGYLFHGTFEPLGSYVFKSSFFVSLSKLPLIAHLPVPLPSPYVYGFDIQKYVAELGHPSYLMGQAGTRGWWYYFPVAFLIKVPIPMLLLFVLSFFALKRDIRDKAVLLLPILCLTLPFVLFTQSNPGIRYMLPVFPFLFLLAGELASVRNKLFAAVFWLLVLWAGYESVRIHPHYLAYFNDLIGGPENGYKYLVDSNLDWGQDQNAVKAYFEKCRLEGKQPAVNPQWPADGTVLVNANNLADCFRTRRKYDWLGEFTPSGNIGYSWLLYSIDVRQVIARWQDGYSDKPLLNFTAAWILSREKGDHAAARKLAGKAIAQLSAKHEQSKNDRILLAKCRYLSGLIASSLQNNTAAEKDFKASLAAYRYFYEAFDALGQMYAYGNDERRAKTFRRQAIAARTLEWYSAAMSTDKRHYEGRIKQDPSDYRAYNNLGFLQWAEGDTDGAIRTFDKALTVIPYFSGTYASLASCYYEKGDKENARKCLRSFYTHVFTVKSFNTQVVVWGDDKIIFDDILVIPHELIIPPDELNALRNS